MTDPMADHDFIHRNFDRSVLEAIVEPYLASGCPAVTIAAWHRGELLCNTAWGENTTTTTLFDLDSVTEVFTTTAFLNLLSFGHAQLDMPIVEVIPEFGGDPRPIDGGFDPLTKQPLPLMAEGGALTVDPVKLTFRHLLTHTSGLAAWRPVMDAAGPAPLPPDQHDPIPHATRWVSGLKYICEAPFVTAPGAVVRYSDLDLMLLGECVARLSSEALDQAIRTIVCDQMWLAETDVCFNPVRDFDLPFARIAPTGDDPGWRKRRAWGEVDDENACGVGGIAGHAGLFGTAEAVMKLGVGWLTGIEEFGIDHALAAQAIQEQATNGAERFGLGWMLKSTVGSSAGDLFSPASFGHTGVTGTSLWIDPPAELVVACLTNGIAMGRDIHNPQPFRHAIHNAIALQALGS